MHGATAARLHPTAGALSHNAAAAAAVSWQPLWQVYHRHHRDVRAVDVGALCLLEGVCQVLHEQVFKDRLQECAPQNASLEVHEDESGGEADHEVVVRLRRPKHFDIPAKADHRYKAFANAEKSGTVTVNVVRSQDTATDEKCHSTENVDA